MERQPMGDDKTVIYEVDWKNQEITFFHAGAWSTFLQLQHPYTYDEVEQIFSRYIYKTKDNHARRSIHHNPDGSLIYYVGERIQSREFEGLIPETGACEWFSDFLVMGDSGNLLGNIRNIHRQKIRELENEYRAKYDQLTGLYNRKTFEEQFAELVKTHETGCLGILDIDNFKRLNDDCGHIQGDRALEAVSRIMQEALPKDSLCGRYGGDEFLVFFPSAPERETVKAVMERLTERLGSLKLNGIALTVSVGLAFCPEWGKDFVTLLGHADTALRFSKKTGKNRCTFCTDAIEHLVKEHDEGPSGGRNRKPKKAAYETQASGKHRMVVLLVTFIILTGALLIGDFYGKSFRKVIIDESFPYLFEISGQISADVLTMVDNNRSKIETLQTIISREPWADGQELQKWLDEVGRIQGFTAVSLLDREWSESRFQQINGKDCLVFGYPQTIRTMDGAAFAGLAAAVELQKVRDRLALPALDGAGHAHIVARDGTLALHADGLDQMFVDNNLFVTLEQAQIYGNESVRQIREQMERNENSRIYYKLDGEERIATLTPSGVDGWYLVTVLSADFIFKQSDAFSRKAMIACLIVGMLFLVLVFVVLAIKEHSRKHLMKAAYVDPVTGGNNLTRFIMQVPHSAAVSGYKSAILYANVVEFKLLNDRLGRTGADEILKKIYQEIEGSLGRGECVGRLMADHFGILLKAENLREVTGRIENWNLQMMRIGSREKEPVSLKMNYGIYFIEDAGLDVSQMLDRANLARRTVGESHRDKVSYAVYDKQLKDRMVYEKELADHMETALEQGEFRMFLQAKHGLQEAGIVGAEALVRWYHPVRGVIMPGDFIPLFEKNGFIERLDLYMFREACKWIQQMLDRGMRPVPLSVNLSVSHFYNHNFIEDFRAVWQEYGFDPSLLELEFTESMLYGKLEEFQDIIGRIKEIGFRCSMDDFGSGYSSLNELACLPLDVIKLDRQFFMDSNRNEQKRITVRYVIELIKALDMEVVAEGVESMEQVEWLRAYGCDIVQGYVFARPEDAAVLFKELIKSAPA